MKHIKRVEIKWFDCTSLDKWEDIDEVIDQENTKEIMTTCGYLLKKTKRFYIIALSLHFNDDLEAVRSAANWYIPCGCVMEVNDL